MSDVYLHSIAIDDFRTFGAFRVEVPPGPSLTLMVGTNGLGKSSFFDALEWGLTGRVRRLQRYAPNADDADYLTRRGAKGVHGVTLGFGGAVETELTRKGAVAPSAEAVISLLKRPDWGAQIHDIGTYLAFTHFLGQAEPQRFTSRDRDEQWAALKGPSGIERLEEVRRGLRGRPTQLAFTRRIKKDADAVAELKRQLDEWAGFRTRLTRLRDAANASGALDGVQLQTRLADLVSQIGRFTTTVSGPPAGETAAATLARLRRPLENARRAVSDQRRNLEDLQSLPERYSAQAAAFEARATPLLEARTQLSSLQSAAEAADARSTATRSTLASLDGEVLQLRNELAALEAVRIDMEAVAVADREALQLEEQRREAEAALSQARVDLAAADAELVASRERAEDLTRRSAAAAAAAEVSHLARGLSKLVDDARRSAEVARELGAMAVSARIDLERLAAERTLIEDERRASQAAVAAARGRATSMAAALAQIASHLHEQDTECPVCRSVFPLGALRRLADESASAQSAELTLAEANDARLAETLSESTLAINQAEAAVTKAAEARLAAESDAAALRQQEERVRSALPAGVTDLLAGALAAEARTSAEFAQASAAVSSGAADLAQATLRRESIPREILEYERRLADLTTAATARDADRQIRVERIGVAGHSQTRVEDLAARTRAVQSALGDAETRQLAARTAAEAASRLAASTRSEFSASTEAVAALEAAQSSAADAVAALESRWHDAGLERVPGAQPLETALASASQRVLEVERLEEEHAVLVIASDAADRDDELRTLIRQMEEIGGPAAADDPSFRATSLARDLASAEEVHRQSQAAQAAVRALSEKLRQEAESFSTQFLEPLNDLIEGFNEALLSTPGNSVRFQADNRVDTTHFEMGLQYRDPLEGALFNKELPPQVDLSEGQLAANGFSILCAASTAYPWSRWRSLLLDDPLQHNDVIHGAAFVDLMRNLVELERYQLLMSSHDRGEADYIARKFDAAGLPCKVIALTAPSRSGVRYEEPPPNLAARSLLESARALSAPPRRADSDIRA